MSFGAKSLFQGANLIVHKNDHIGLIGRNGRGKSSLFKILTGELAADKSEPALKFDKNPDYSTFLVPQEIPFQLDDSITISNIIYHFYPKLKKVNDELTEINNRIADEPSLLEKQNKLMEQMDHLDAWDLIERYQSYLKFFGHYDHELLVKNLSGGEQKKILLSLGLSSKAQIILWDEPTNHLDIETIKLLEDELSGHESTFILITHDRYLLDKVSKRIVHIHNAKIDTYSGNYNDFIQMQAKKDEERQRLIRRLSNRLRREQDWMNQGVKARGTKSKKRIESFHILSERIGGLKNQIQREMKLNLMAGNKKSKKIIDFKDVSFGYQQQALFENFNFEIHKGDRIGLVGKNGVGKTTLIKLILDDLKPTNGKIKRADDLSMQYFSQDRSTLKEDQTPFELMTTGSDQIKVEGSGNTHIAAYLDKFNFDRNDMNRPIKTFSGGEKNRIQMAMNLSTKGDLWIFDEPTNDLDLETLDVLEQALKDFEGTIILISHDRSFLSSVTNKVLLIEDQKLEIFEGGYEQVEAWLDLRDIEKELSDDKAEEVAPEKEPETVSKTPTLSKKDISKIEEAISEKEELIGKIDELIQSLGSLQSSEESVEKLVKLSEKKEQEEELLMELYERLESKSM